MDDPKLIIRPRSITSIVGRGTLVERAPESLRRTFCWEGQPREIPLSKCALISELLLASDVYEVLPTIWLRRRYWRCGEPSLLSVLSSGAGEEVGVTTDSTSRFETKLPFDEEELMEDAPKPLSVNSSRVFFLSFLGDNAFEGADLVVQRSVSNDEYPVDRG